jgi:hypothetical protein
MFSSKILIILLLIAASRPLRPTSPIITLGGGGSPTLDVGAAYPLSTILQDTSTATIAQTGVTTTGSGLIVVALVGNAPVNNFPFTLAGAGLSWNSIYHKTYTGASPGGGTAEVWAAWSSSILTNQTITATKATGNNGSLLITVWAYTAASVKACSGNVTTCFGAVGGKEQDATITVDASLIGVISTSKIIGAYLQGFNNSGLTALSNTTWHGINDDSVNGSSERTGESTGTGSVIVGSSTSNQYVATAAVEILGN